MIESLPLLFIFVVLLAYGMGFFGIVHTGILNSIGARNYAFETFSNRAILTLFRDDPGTDERNILYYDKAGSRYHGIRADNSPNDSTSFATTRPLALGIKPPTSSASVQEHNIDIYALPGRNRNGVAASPAWIMIGYGICIDSKCGD